MTDSKAALDLALSATDNLRSALVSGDPRLIESASLVVDRTLALYAAALQYEHDKGFGEYQHIMDRLDADLRARGVSKPPVAEIVHPEEPDDR